MTCIAIDIDDTLYDFNGLARSVFIDVALEAGDKRLQRGAYCPWTEWRSPSDVSDPDTWGGIIQRCHADDNIIAQTPYPDAAHTLWELEEEGYTFHYISNRRPEAAAATTEWLYDHRFPLGAPHKLSCTYEDKIVLLRHCRYLVDDRPKTLVQFVYDFHWKHKHGSEPPSPQRLAFGLHTPYNAALTDVPGIKLAPNWKLLRQYMIDQEVLRSPVGTHH